MYQNKAPVFEIISGASVAIASLLLIIPGFFTDTIGFLLLFPLTRNIFLKNVFKEKNKNSEKENNNTINGEIVDKKKDEL